MSPESAGGVTFSRLVEIVDLIAGTMTIVGAGGIVSWGFLKQKTSGLADKVVEVFGYSIKTAIILWLRSSGFMALEQNL